MNKKSCPGYTVFDLGLLVDSMHGWQ